MDVPPGARRAKLVFTNRALHRALALPSNVRVAFVHSMVDPGLTSVVIEGPGVPVVPIFYADGSYTRPTADELAFFGETDAPVLNYSAFLEQSR